MDKVKIGPYNRQRRNSMGILTTDELEKIDKQIEAMNYGMITFIPVMVKGDMTVMLDKKFEVVYFLEGVGFESCYKKQTKAGFIKSIDELKKEGWILT